MPVQNDFKAFATGGGAMVLSQASYEALGALAIGFNSGTAVKEQLNKVWRQSSFASAVLMQYIAETLNSDSLDDGDLAAHVERLRDALSAGASNPTGSSAVRGLLAQNTAAALTTKMDLQAARITFVDANDKILVRDDGAVYTCDTGLGGPVVNGRDQAGAFGANSWLYFYFILDPIADTIASLVSATPPEAFDGSSLPGAYTYWAFAFSARFDAGSLLKRQVAQGNEVVYGGLEQVLNNGAAVVETAVSVASSVPDNADTVTYNAVAERSAAGSNASAKLRHLTGIDFMTIDTRAAEPLGRATVTMPARGQNLYYLWSLAAGGRELDIYVSSYTVRNGG